MGPSDKAVLLRVLGAAGGGRTTFAVSQAAEILATDERRLVVIDTLGHGANSAIEGQGLGERSIFKIETSANLVLAVSRHLIASGGVACVIVDDLPGLDFGQGGDQWGRTKAVAGFVQSLSGIALAFKTSLILVDRSSDFGTRPPLGFRDEFVAEKQAA